MLKHNVLNYVDCTMAKIDAPAQKKLQIENELMRYMVEASENSDFEEVKKGLPSSQELAQAITGKLFESEKAAASSAFRETCHEEKHHRHHPRYVGEYMQEHSNVNLKLLYIPLLQISSGTQRIVMPLTDEEED